MHTGPIPAVVTAEITMNLVIGAEFGMPVPATFGFCAHEPLSVTAKFQGGETEVEWVFARDLLQGGTERPVGDGDVTCWPSTIAGQRLVCIALRSPSGQALLEAPAAAIHDFLHRSYDVVPAGGEAEFLDLDTLIETLLSS